MTHSESDKIQNKINDISVNPKHLNTLISLAIEAHEDEVDRDGNVN